MAFLSSSPKILKGAFVRFDPEFPNGRAITFQYNPEKIFRRLESVEDGDAAATLPRETYSFVLKLDATDDLESPDQHKDTVKNGIYPLLSALESLLYPYDVSKAQKRFLGNKRRTNADKHYLTLLIWGNKRVVPVKVTELRIQEEMFDPILNPLRATVIIRMQVLNDSDLSPGHRGFRHWKSHLKTKITMAKVAYAEKSVDNLTSIK